MRATALVVVLCALVAAAGPTASAAIKVESERGRTLVTFKKVHCFKEQGGVAGRAVKRGWEFVFTFPAFRGYRQYPLFYSTSTDHPIVDVSRPHAKSTDDTYGNIFSPEAIEDEPAGHLSFPGKGKQLKLDLHYAYSGAALNTPPDTTTLDVAGTATCQWRGKKPLADHGRGWFRTTDLSRVRRALSH